MIGAELEGLRPGGDDEDIVFAIDAEQIYKSVGQPQPVGRESFQRVDSPIFLRSGDRSDVLVVRDRDRKDALRAPAVNEWPLAELLPSLVSRDTGRLETYVLINTTTVTELNLDGFGEAA